VTTESYKRFLKIFFIVFIPITLLADFGKYLEIINIRACWFFILYANSILALIILYFGIYAHISGINKEQKSDKPVVFIILGCLLMLLSFGRPIFATYMVNHIEKTIEPIHISSENLEKQKKAALDVTVWSSIRLSFAKHYYLDTGESIEYFDESNNKKLYAPDKETKDRYEKKDQMNKEMKRISAFVRINGLAHGSILLLSIPTFLLFIRHKKNNYSN
jgi:hypothetical protein